MSGARQRSYIVFGCTGEYEDYSAWPIITYSVATAADEHVAKANQWAKDNGYAGYAHGRERRPNSPWDPYMLVDYTGTSYFVRSVPARISSVRVIREGEG